MEVKKILISFRLILMKQFMIIRR